MASLADLIRSQSAAAQRQGMSHQDSYSQMDPGMERYLAGQESATRGVPLEAPMLAPDDLIGSGLLKGLLGGAALMGSIKSVGRTVKPLTRKQANALAENSSALDAMRKTHSEYEAQELAFWPEAKSISDQSAWTGARADALSNWDMVQQSVLNNQNYLNVVANKNAVAKRIAKEKSKIADEMYRQSRFQIEPGAPDLLAAENPDSTRSLKDLIPK
jgi:hypothetical protein